MANYQWRAELHFQSGDPDWLSHGVTPDAQSDWQTATAGTGDTRTYTYWYRDSNTAWSGHFQDILSSRVATSVTQSWSTSVDNLNNLTVTVTTTINSVVRDDIQHPSGYSDSNTPGRNINIYNSGGGTVFSTTDNQVATAHTLSGAINVGTETFTLASGNATVVKPSLTMHNQTVGGPSYDDMWLGVQFRNPLPVPTTYRLTYNANGGSGAPGVQERITADDSVTFTISNTEPTWGNYQFLGWSRTRYTDSRTETDVEYRAGDSIALQKASPTLTLYAVWRMDYRPGASLDTNTGKWKSHNRMNGACHVLNGSTWKECRTIGGEVNAMGKAPVMRRSDKWYNQKLFGLGLKGV